MSLKTNLQAQLNRAGGDRPQQLTAEEGPLRLVCDLAEVHPLACRFERLAVQSPRLREMSLDQLKHLGESLAERVTYLLEPIAPIEADAESCTVQLRSHPPQKDETGACYYEVVASRTGELSLRRYRKNRGAARQPVTAVVTQEVLLRLTDDFEAVLR